VNASPTIAKHKVVGSKPITRSIQILASQFKIVPRAREVASLQPRSNNQRTARQFIGLSTIFTVITVTNVGRLGKFVLVRHKTIQKERLVNRPTG
jgi:hypothetical protein